MTTVVPHFSNTRRAGDFVFVSGQLPFTAPGEIVEGGIEEQVSQCLRNIDLALGTEGLSLSDVVKTMVWLTSPEDFPAFNETYARYFPGNPPARATVCSALMVPGARVEIEAVAFDGREA